MFPAGPTFFGWVRGTCGFDILKNQPIGSVRENSSVWFGRFLLPDLENLADAAPSRSGDGAVGCTGGHGMEGCAGRADLRSLIPQEFREYRRSREAGMRKIKNALPQVLVR